jgi:hypothetical protein
MRVSKLALLAALVLPACSSGSSSSASEGGGSFAAPQEDRVFIEVDNQNFDRATIWYTTTGNQRRLGIVEGKTRHTFTIENWRVTAPMVVTIHLTAGGRCVTPELQTDPGDNLYLQIPTAGLRGSC